MPQMAPRLISALRRRVRPKHVIDVASEGHLIELAHWAERRTLRLVLTPQMLRMQGAFVYGVNHPFVAALREGRGSLEHFYGVVRPTTISDYYGLDGRGARGADLPPWELPWYLRKDRTPPPGELGLSADEGVSFYGPVSPAKIDLEMDRLSKLKTVIARGGYDPDGHGDIEGYILRDGDKACFFVRGGKHRAAVLAALGHEKIPVSFRTGFPRLIDTAQAEFWPLVRDGTIDRKLACQILAAYTKGRKAITLGQK